jgi:Fe-S-cluster containining protein
MSVEGEIRRFRKDLKKARSTSPDEVAKHLPAFKCAGCAKCCRGAFGDNTVTVFPREIRKLMAATGLEWLDIVVPEQEDGGDADDYGNYHAFEWALRKKPDGDCLFLASGRCTVYESRPCVCRTYPFYLEEGRVGHGECEGLSCGNKECGHAMAQELIARSVLELEESLALLERLDLRAGRGARGLIVVHDSEGACLVAEVQGQLHFHGKARQ